MAKIKSYKFTVSGSFNFPCDMLRYDACYPASSEDAAELHAAIRQEERRMYKVALVGPRQPTGGRWSSFCWQVVEVEGRSY